MSWGDVMYDTYTIPIYYTVRNNSRINFVRFPFPLKKLGLSWQFIGGINVSHASLCPWASSYLTHLKSINF